MDKEKEVRNNKKEVRNNTPDREAKPAAEVDEIVQAHKRRTALVIYLMILFVAALVFVVISMISENNKLKNRGDSAIDRAQSYYDENQTLKKENEDLQQQLTDAAAEQEALNARIEEQESTLADLKAENEALQQQQSDALTASDLLIQALAARANDDAEGFAAAMEALAPLKDSLSEHGLILYQSLLAETPEE